MKGKMLVLPVLLFMGLQLAVSGQSAENVIKLTAITSARSVKIEIYESMPATQQKYFVAITNVKDGKVLFDQPVKFVESSGIKKTFFINNLQPKLWFPNSPELYKLEFTVQNGKNKTTTERKIGFRDFKATNGKFYINGKPIFLKGNAINPPGRGIPDSVTAARKFAEDYINFLKSININIIRFTGTAQSVWYDVCDELGMMVFGGNYSGSVNGEAPPKDYEKALKWFQENKFASLAHHPSLMIYVINNETAFGGTKGEAWLKFQNYIYNNLNNWDSTRAYIGNAGYGYGKAGNVCDLHRYWGWYYNTPFTFINIRDQRAIIPFDKPKHQPITFTECVGNYVGPDGRYNLTPDNKAPQSQLNWTGHAPDDLQPMLANEHQAFTYKMATELFRRMRYLNPDLSGVVPFTILFDNWNTISRFSDMYPKPVTQQAKISFQPVLISWENWTPNLYAGSTFHPILHIVNDDTSFKDLEGATVTYSIIDQANNELYTDSLQLPTIKYYDTYKQKLTINIPATASTGWYKLSGKIIKNKNTISKNTDPIYIATKNFATTTPPLQKKVLLYDPKKMINTALDKLGIKYQQISSFSNLNTDDIVIIGESGADGNVYNAADNLKKFVISGGRILILKQQAENWQSINAISNVQLQNLIADIDKADYPKPQGAAANGIHINPERPEHIIFSGIDRKMLRFWSDYTNWDETQSGFPAIYPVTNGFILKNKQDIGSTAVFANYGPGLSAMALAEFFNGKGSIIVSGLDIAKRLGSDPVADRLLKNLINYTSQSEHNRYPLITSPIVWGNYESEKGILTGEVSGLLLNPTPRLLGNDKIKYKVIITEDGHQFASGNTIGWADFPGQQYIPYGRRPFGPYYLRGPGSIAEIEKDADKTTGSGFFYCSIPAGKTMAVTTVWNPAPVEAIIKIKVNNNEVMKSVAAKSTSNIECPVQYNDFIKMEFTGDRRLVLLQTLFQ